MKLPSRSVSLGILLRCGAAEARHSSALLAFVGAPSSSNGAAVAGRHADPSSFLVPRRPYRTSSSLCAIVDEVTEQMKVAMKAKDTARLATIRLIRSAFANAAIDLKVEQLSDDQAIPVLRKMAKMRQDSIRMFEDGGATERANAERTELAIIESWLPTVANEDTTRKWVQEAIETVGLDNVGKVMGALMKAHKSEVDGSLAQKLVKEEIAKAKQ